MDIAPTPDTLSMWLITYGSIAIFVLMTVGIIALPVPEETFMIIAGVLMHKGKLNIPATVISAYLGAICGITVSYLLGRLAGKFLIQKYGKWIGITENRMTKVHRWFERFGKWALLIGYFIPGIRHFTGLSAGTTALAYKQFALFAYTGAAIWVSIFLSIGYFFGSVCISRYEEIEIGFDVITIAVILLVVFCIIFMIKKFSRKN